jgi:hypothetical protein
MSLKSTKIDNLRMSYIKLFKVSYLNRKFVPKWFHKIDSSSRTSPLAAKGLSSWRSRSRSSSPRWASRLRRTWRSSLSALPTQTAAPSILTILSCLRDFSTINRFLFYIGGHMYLVSQCIKVDARKNFPFSMSNHNIHTEYYPRFEKVQFVF